METHHIHPELLKHKVRILVVGSGGNGTAIAAGLPYLHHALLAYRHPEGIHVTLLDPELISPTNCVRQPFSRSEISLYKSVVLANRLNLFWGLDWEGIPERLDVKRRLDGVDIVIGGVDTRAARAGIAKCTGDWSEVDYWLGLGNNADTGQFILGEPLNRRNRRYKLRLPTVSELFPEVIKDELDRDGLPSCSAADALVAGAVRQSDIGESRTGSPCGPVSLRDGLQSRRIRRSVITGRCRLCGLIPGAGTGSEERQSSDLKG
jgi:PRTRC genetic system ThiF family protein